MIEEEKKKHTQVLFEPFPMNYSLVINCMLIELPGTSIWDGQTKWTVHSSTHSTIVLGGVGSGWIERMREKAHLEGWCLIKDSSSAAWFILSSDVLYN